MYTVLQKLIEGNPLFDVKLPFPSFKASQLRTLINQRCISYIFLQTEGSSFQCYFVRNITSRIGRTSYINEARSRVQHINQIDKIIHLFFDVCHQNLI